MSVEIADKGTRGVLEVVPQHISEGSLEGFLKEFLEELPEIP